VQAKLKSRASRARRRRFDAVEEAGVRRRLSACEGEGMTTIINRRHTGCPILAPGAWRKRRLARSGAASKAQRQDAKAPLVNRLTAESATTSISICKRRLRLRVSRSPMVVAGIT
jgi:hypothetical protein